MLHRITHALTCRDVTRLLSQRQDRALSLAERVKLRLHLLVCTACSRFERQLRLLHAAMRKYRA